MATYRQLHESLNLSEEKPKNAKPGDVWRAGKNNDGAWYGMKKGKDGEDQTNSFGKKKKSKEKATVYATGGDPDKIDDGEKEKLKKKSTAGKSWNRKREKVQNQIENIKDEGAKKRATIISDAMDKYADADDDEKAEILKYLGKNKLISINTDDPNTKTKKIYFDPVLTGLDYKSLGGNSSLEKDMHKIIMEKGIHVTKRLDSANRALADMSGKHNVSGMVFAMTPKDSPDYVENKKIHEENEKRFKELGGPVDESNRANQQLAEQITASLPKGVKVTGAKNTGGIGKSALLDMGIDPKTDPTDLLVNYNPPKNGRMKISAKTYTDPSHITMKNSGARRVGSEYLGDEKFDSDIQAILAKPEYNYREEGISKDESKDRKRALKEEYVDAMGNKMQKMADTEEGQQQFEDMWKKVHGCGKEVSTSVVNKTTGETTLHPPEYYCEPTRPFKVIKNGTSLTVQLDDDGEDSVEIVLKTEKTGTKLLFNHLKREPKSKKEQYESLEGTISRIVK